MFYSDFSKKRHETILLTIRETSPLSSDQFACGLPVAGEARLISYIETLAEQTHPLNLPRSLQLSQPTMTSFTLIHLQSIGTIGKCFLQQQIKTNISLKLYVSINSFRRVFPHLVAYDLSLHGHTEAGERAVTDGSRHDSLTAFSLCQLVGLGLTAVQGLRGEETHMAVPAGDDGQQLLLENQVDVVHLLVVPHPDNF